MIQPGQIWVADVYGKEARVRVVASHIEFPDKWVCEQLDQQAAGPRLYVLLERRELKRLASSCSHPTE